MRDDQLARLLQDAAERLDTSPAPAAELSRQVRRLSVQRRRQRTLAISGGVACLLVAGLFAAREFLARRGTLPPVAQKLLPQLHIPEPTAPATASDAHQLALLDSELRVSARVRQLLRSRPEQSHDSRDNDDDWAIDDFRLDVDLVAAELLRKADELRGSRQADASALAYQQVIDSFPHTRSARLAQARLAELHN